MAENPLLPNTDIEIIEKYPPGRRADFPDFGSVCKTSFSKGTITDFEKISDDPIAVKPRVKVTGDFGESDYIPLFYHPKEKYWDGPTGPPIFESGEYPDIIGWKSPSLLATDYNKEGGYFEKAWMSFRCGDEVAVMLKEGVPVAIVGFADGKPRVGENILKVDLGAGYWYNALISRVTDGYYAGRKEAYAGHDKGPDGLDLGLSLECEHITLKSHTAEYEFSDGWDFNWNYVGRIVTTEIPANPPFAYCRSETKQVWESGTQITTYYYSKSKTEFKEYAYLVKIGPILFWIDVDKSVYTVERQTRSENWPVSFDNATWDWCIMVYPDYPCTGSPYAPGCLDYLAAQVIARTESGTLGTPPGTQTDYGSQSSIGAVYAAIYSKELYGKAKAITDRDNRPSEFIHQGYGYFYWNIPYSELRDLPNLPVLKVRPHTKEEGAI